MRRILPLVAAIAGAAAQPALAQELDGVWFVGGTVGDSSSAYGGAIHALPGARLGEGLAISASINGGKYEYEAGGGLIDGEYIGGEIALVLQKSGEWGWANFSAGPRLTDITLKPDDPTNDRRGTRPDLGLQADGAFDLAKYRARWYGSFGAFDHAYGARLQLGRKLGENRYELGVEGGISGDPSFMQKSLGPYVAAPLGGNLVLQIGTGIVWDDADETSAYGSLGLSSVF